MKMLYQRSKTRSTIARLSLPALLVSIGVVLGVSGVHVPVPVSSAAHEVARPFWGVRDSLIATVVATYESLESKEALIRENVALHNELSAMRRESFMARVLVRENDELRAIVGRGTTDEGLVPAAIINDEFLSPYDTFVIDVGARAGIRDGMLVVSPEGLALGTVSRVLTDSAIVTSLASAGQEAGVVLRGTTTVHATLRGQGGGTMLMRIPRDLQLAPGDPVILPSFSANPVGEVAEIDVRPEDAYQTVYVRSAANLFQARYVLVDTIHTVELAPPDTLMGEGAPGATP